jgi:hypothetical protein
VIISQPKAFIYSVLIEVKRKLEIKGFYLWKNRWKRFNWKVLSKAAYGGIKIDQNGVNIRIQKKVNFVIRFKVPYFMLCICKLRQVIHFLLFLVDTGLVSCSTVYTVLKTTAVMVLTVSSWKGSSEACTSWTQELWDFTSCRSKNLSHLRTNSLGTRM